MILLVLIPVLFLSPSLFRFALQLAGHGPPARRPHLSLWQRGLCVLLAYIFLIGPDCFQILSSAAVQYGDISTLAWGTAGDIIEYGYDSNGSLTSKTTKQGSDVKEQVIYEYSLQNRISKVTTTKITNLDGDGTDDDKIIEETLYKYNPSGIRTSSEFTLSHQIENNTPQLQAHTFTDFLIDPANHTGYAQVLEETTYDQIDTDSASRIHYCIGSDVISQTKSTGEWNTDHFNWTASPTQYLLYDGHGSTRQLISHDGSIQDTYSYDGYGVSLGGNPTTENPADTNLLYCGEQYDNSMQQYYLRARCYNQNSGIFNRMDDHFGNYQEPQSLHKYLYCNANPINANDPSGTFSLSEVLTASTIMAMMMYIIASPNVANAPGPDTATIPDKSGDMILDAGITMGLAVGGILVVRFIFQPARAAVSPYIRGLLDRLRFRNPIPVSSLETPITNPSRLLTGSTQLEINQEMGAAFEDAVRASLRTTKGTSVLTSHGTVVPDLPVGNMYGVTDAKNVIKLVQSPQTRGFQEIAISQNMPFNLVISPRTQTVSKPLQEAIKSTGGTIFEFDSVKGVFNLVKIIGNKVIR